MLQQFDVLSGWHLAPDDPPPLGARPQALLTASLLDEITGLPPEKRLQASTSNAGLTGALRSAEYEATKKATPISASMRFPNRSITSTCMSDISRSRAMPRSAFFA